MSKQINFFHTERDTLHLLQEIEMNDGVFLVNSKPMLPTLLSDLILQKWKLNAVESFKSGGVIGEFKVVALVFVIGLTKGLVEGIKVEYVQGRKIQ